MVGDSSERGSGHSVSVKRQMEDYLGNIFDTKNRDAHAKSVPPREEEQDISQPFSVDKRDVTFKSNIKRE